VDAQREQRIALLGGSPVQLGGRGADGLLLRLDLGPRGLFGVSRLLQLRLPEGDLLLQLPVAPGVLEQRALCGQCERGGVERVVALSGPVGTRQDQGRDRGQQ
jgi:hypothetical protein